MLFYPAALPLSRQTLDYTAGIIRRHRRAIGSCWRKLNPARQALLVLAYSTRCSPAMPQTSSSAWERARVCSRTVARSQR